jgi:hypothetical protein
MSIGTELNDSRFGPRVIKVNVKAQIKFRAGLKNGRYYGEWSEQLQQPHGRGIFIEDNGGIYIRNFMNGTTKVQTKCCFFSKT